MRTEDFISEKDVIKLETLCGWIVNYGSMAGTVSWIDDGINPEFEVFATPNWEGDGRVPIAVMNYKTDEYVERDVIDFTKSKYVGNLKLQLEVYKKRVETIISELQ